MEKKNGKRFVTNQHAMLIIDGSAKELHLNGVSNSNVTEVRRTFSHEHYDSDIRRLRSPTMGT